MTPSTAPAAVARRVCLVGNPNVGKSVVFGALTGRYAAVSNYPGTTVEVTRGAVRLEQGESLLIDTPGTNGFIPQSEDERVTRDLLLEGPSLLLQVADEKNLSRSLALTLQLAETGLPIVLCLNMSDEAEELGIRTDRHELATALGIDVAPTVATRRTGMKRLMALLAHARPASIRINYGPAIEGAIARIEPLLPAGPIAPRAIALALLSGDETLAEWVRDRLSAERRAQLLDELARADRGQRSPIALEIQTIRIQTADRLAAGVTGSAAADTTPLRAKLGALSMRAPAGWLIAAGVLYLLYLFVGVFGAQIGVRWLEEGVFGRINPIVRSFLETHSPWPLLTDLISGPYGLLSMGLTYAVAIVLPIVVTFFLAFAVLEDSGYLPRLAVMLNRVFRTMGLNGRAVLPMVLGLGCDTMATLTTRILPTRKERTIVILLLALGIPCSAQLGVILALLAALSWKASAVWAGVVAGVLLLVGYLASLVLPGSRAEFILEIPPIRWPRPGNLARKTMARVEWYLKEAVPLFLVGTLILFIADRTVLLAAARRAAEPVVTLMLGLPAAAADAFIIGFLRRDFGAAGLFRLAENGALTPVQIVVSLVTMTLFIPCIANLLMIIKEQGTRVGLLVAAFVFPFAVLVGTLLRVVLAATGADLL